MTDIRFKGNRAYYFSYLAVRWLPISADKARLMIATGEATDVTNSDHPRNRQCSIGDHDGCSDPAGERCKCPCHTVQPGDGPRHDDPRPFVLIRDEDPTGVSGTGVVAQGVEFADGVVALRWLGDWPTSVVFHDQGVRSVQAIHGHGGKTRIAWTGGR